MSELINLKSIPLIIAHAQNFSHAERRSKQIYYIVMHYTGNIGDTAENNVRYFAKTITKSSAHYFVSGSTIMQSVPCNYPAYSVGLGNMKKPYTPNPSHYRICNNANSISIEMCGSAYTREATTLTKETACELAATLMVAYNIPLENVIRHYDVTGKLCPAWAVNSDKWIELTNRINELYKLMLKGEEEMTYEDFKLYFDQYMNEKGAQAPTWEQKTMDWAKDNGLIKDGKPKALLTRGEMATILRRVYDQFGK